MKRRRSIVLQSSQRSWRWWQRWPSSERIRAADAALWTGRGCRRKRAAPCALHPGRGNARWQRAACASAAAPPQHRQSQGIGCVRMYRNKLVREPTSAGATRAARDRMGVSVDMRELQTTRIVMGGSFFLGGFCRRLTLLSMEGQVGSNTVRSLRDK